MIQRNFILNNVVDVGKYSCHDWMFG